MMNKIPVDNPAYKIRRMKDSSINNQLQAINSAMTDTRWSKSWLQGVKEKYTLEYNRRHGAPRIRKPRQLIRPRINKKAMPHARVPATAEDVVIVDKRHKKIYVHAPRDFQLPKDLKISGILKDHLYNMIKKRGLDYKTIDTYSILDSTLGYQENKQLLKAFLQINVTADNKTTREINEEINQANMLFNVYEREIIQKEILMAVRTLEKWNGTAAEDEILNFNEDGSGLLQHFPPETIIQNIADLKQSAELYMPRDGYYKVV